jgi:capsular polysaccharide biosynthesis protein
MENVLPFQKETFEILKDKFQLIDDLSKENNYEIVSIYGDTCLTSIADRQQYTIPYLRKLFLDRLKYDIVKGKRIYITRKNSENQHSGVLKRAIINENEFKTLLNKYNIEYVQLEDFSMEEKIKLFMESELIISSHSGSLTLTMFANKNCKVLEILKEGTYGFNHSHYINICKIADINYNRYSNINEDYNGNFNINLVDFEKYLLNII